MQNCKWTKELVTLGIAVVALANSLAPSKAQAEENFAWITNTNGVTWKAAITSPDGNSKGSRLFFHYGDGVEEAAQILVPEHAIIDQISVGGCVNLTNIILQPAKARSYRNPGLVVDATRIHIQAQGSGLRNITRRETMDVRVTSFGQYRHSLYPSLWLPIRRSIQWTELKELPRIEIRTHATDNGPELEIVWREGILQIADVVNGKWKNYNGNSPLIIPLWLAKDKQFFRIRKGDE